MNLLHFSLGEDHFCCEPQNMIKTNVFFGPRVELP